MPIVEAEPKGTTQATGARSLSHICLDSVADAMLDDPSHSLEVFSVLDWKLQQDLLAQLLEDRQKKQELEEENSCAKASVPLADWEAQIELDPNEDFIETNEEYFTDENGENFLDVMYDTSTPTLEKYWSDFLESADMPNSKAPRNPEPIGSVHILRSKAPRKSCKPIYDQEEVRLVENSTDSLIRFSICLEDRCGFARHKHFTLKQLISKDLLLHRMDALQNAPGCDYSNDSYTPGGYTY
jgi:hypothetical protein